MKQRTLSDRKGEKNPNAKLTNAQVQEIKALLAQGEMGTVIARKFGVTSSCICRIKRGNRRN